MLPAQRKQLLKIHDEFVLLLEEYTDNQNKWFDRSLYFLNQQPTMETKQQLKECNDNIKNLNYHIHRVSTTIHELENDLGFRQVPGAGAAGC